VEGGHGAAVRGESWKSRPARSRPVFRAGVAALHGADEPERESKSPSPN
jgi:hypothetical protein